MFGGYLWHVGGPKPHCPHSWNTHRFNGYILGEPPGHPIYFLPLITSPARVVVKYCNGRVCLYVCVSVCPRAYLPNHTRDLYQFFVHVAYRRVSVSSGRVTQFQGEWAILEVCFPIDNALYAPYTHLNHLNFGGHQLYLRNGWSRVAKLCMHLGCVKSRHEDNKWLLKGAWSWSRDPL